MTKNIPSCGASLVLKRVTMTATFAKSSPSMALRIGLPAVPEGSPSSLLRAVFAPTQAQQL